jgi:hypothetical protein
MMQSSASLNSNNFKIVAPNVQGTCKTTKILFIGGLAKNAMVAEAKENLLASHPLKEGQALANIAIDFKNSIFPFVNSQKCTVTADIVQFY